MSQIPGADQQKWSWCLERYIIYCWRWTSTTFFSTDRREYRHYIKGVRHLTEVRGFLPDAEKEPDGYQPVLVLEQGRLSYAARIGTVLVIILPGWGLNLRT